MIDVIAEAVADAKALIMETLVEEANAMEVSSAEPDVSISKIEEDEKSPTAIEISKNIGDTVADALEEAKEFVRDALVEEANAIEEGKPDLVNEAKAEISTMESSVTDKIEESQIIERAEEVIESVAEAVNEVKVIVVDAIVDEVTAMESKPENGENFQNPSTLAKESVSEELNTALESVETVAMNEVQAEMSQQILSEGDSTVDESTRNDPVETAIVSEVH